MALMVQRVPDEYFRTGAAESDDVVTDPSPPRPPEDTTAESVAPRPARTRIPLRAAVIVAILAVALSYGIGRLFIFPATPATLPVLSPSAVPTRSPQPSPDGVRPYDGPLTAIAPVAAAGECQQGGTRESPMSLLDDDPSTPWRCRGSGVGETFTVVFEGTVPLVGIRLINGNTAWQDRYSAERRITAIRWTFADGSYFEQGLAASDPNPQEVRFPRLLSDRATVEVLNSTVPGGVDESSDAVSISSLEFLTPDE